MREGMDLQPGEGRNLGFSLGLMLGEGEAAVVYFSCGVELLLSKNVLYCEVAPFLILKRVLSFQVTF